MNYFYYDYLTNSVYEITENDIEENDILWYKDDYMALYAACECYKYSILKTLENVFKKDLQQAVNGIYESCYEFSELYNK